MKVPAHSTLTLEWIHSSNMKTNLKKRMTIMIIALIIVFGGIIGFNLLKSYMMKQYFAHFEMPAVTVSSVKAQKQDWYPSLPAVGSFVAINGVDVNSQASGKVTQIHINSGEFVEKGKPLIDIDDYVEQATLKFNQAELTLQKINYKRQTDLFKRGATPSSSLDEARAKLEQAQAEVAKTETLINQKHIKAPFSGRLGLREINLGQYITPGQTSIVPLQSMDPLFLEFYLPEHLLKRIHVTQDITFTVEQNPGLIFTGKITAINARVDINTHNIKVQATVPNCPANALKNPTQSKLVKTQKLENHNKLLVECNTALNTQQNIKSFNFIPGMFADIKVQQPTKSDVVVLPTTAISYSLYGDSVYIIEKDEKNKNKDSQDIYRVKRVFITTGDQQGNLTVVKSGIKAGQTVVGAGALKLQDGTRVVINNDVKLNDKVNPESLSE